MATMEPKRDVSLTVTMPTVSLCKRSGQPRYCDICQCVKPDRTHHCKECDACVLKMDHHCPWVNGCVGFGNYKFFLLFVFYTTILALWTLGTTVPELVSMIELRGLDLNFHLIVVTIFALIFGLLLLCFVGVHTFYILFNRTTIEAIADRPYYVRIDLDSTQGVYQVVQTEYGEHLWSIGYVRNWKSVMGNKPWAWLLPIYTTPGTGLAFPYTNSVYDRFVSEAEKRRLSPMPALAIAVPLSPSSITPLNDSSADSSNKHLDSNLGEDNKGRGSLEFDDRNSSDYEIF